LLLDKGEIAMLEEMRKMIAEQLNCEESEITADTSFKDDLGADSLDIFQIIMAIEEEFEIEIPTEEAEKITTVGDAVEQIKKAL
jgi:acyl carrier protein